jgi:hypothetical protein
MLQLFNTIIENSMATSQPMSFQATLLNISHHHVTPDQCGLTSHVDRL